MGRLKVKIPKGKELAWFVKDRWTKRARYLMERMAEEKHPGLPNMAVGSTTTTFMTEDPDNFTAYALVFQHRLFPTPRKPRPRKGEDHFEAEYRRQPVAACFLAVLEYLEKTPLIYLEWIIDLNDTVSSKHNGHEVWGAFQFDTLKAIEFYARECQRCYGGLSPKRYYPAPAAKDAKPKLRRLDVT